MELLVAKDDALTVRDIATELQLTSGVVSSCLHTLYRHYVVDVIEGQRSLWWYATPETDTRLRVLKVKTDKEEKRAEHKPGRPYPKHHKRNERPKRT
jgi:DNA-binding transcriptional regulator GbsR (MarR family)